MKQSKPPTQMPHKMWYKTTKQQITRSIEYLDLLNKKYKQKQQKSFLHTFNEFIDKMSNQLISNYEGIQHIDQEISTDPDCSYLISQLQFFKDHCFEMYHQLEAVNQQIRKEKQRNSQLKAKTKQTSNILREDIKQIGRYQSLSKKVSIDSNPDNNISKNLFQAKSKPKERYWERQRQKQKDKDWEKRSSKESQSQNYKSVTNRLQQSIDLKCSEKYGSRNTRDSIKNRQKWASLDLTQKEEIKDPEILNLNLKRSAKIVKYL